MTDLTRVDARRPRIRRVDGSGQGGWTIPGRPAVVNGSGRKEFLAMCSAWLADESLAALKVNEFREIIRWTYPGGGEKSDLKNGGASLRFVRSLNPKTAVGLNPASAG